MIPLAKPSLGELEARAAYDTVLSGWVMQGPKVAEFERLFAACVRSPNACAVANGTAALILALQAIGVRHGDVVATVSHSFIATANAIRASGAEPLFVDIEPGGYNLDPHALRRVLEEECVEEDGGCYLSDIDRLLVLPETPLRYAQGRRGRVAAILTVHQMGFPCDLKAIREVATRYRLPLVEDAACAIGSTYHGEPIGKPHGDLATFSFHPRKVLTTGEGGMVTTSHTDMDDQCRLLRQHGVAMPAVGGVKECYLTTGFNYRLTDIQAAIGIVQINRLAEIVKARRGGVEVYRRYLAGQDRFNIPNEPLNTTCNWQSLPIAYDGTAVDQMALLAYLQKEGVTAKPGIMNAHEEPPYAGVWNLPESERRRRETVLLPLFESLDAADIGRVANALRQFGGH